MQLARVIISLLVVLLLLFMYDLSAEKKQYSSVGLKQYFAAKVIKQILSLF